MFTPTRLNAMLDAELAAGDKISLHSAYSATGANELAGGSYARQTVTWASAAGGAKASSAAVNVPVPAGSTVGWIGVWDSTGAIFRGMSPNGGQEMTFQVDLANNRIYCEGHGLANDQRVVFLGGAPTGLTVGTAYYVVGVTAGDPDYLQVAATSGGAAIDITGQAAAGAVLSKIVLEAYAADGTHQVSSLSVSL